jgi:hypothetical protein
VSSWDLPLWPQWICVSSACIFTLAPHPTKLSHRYGKALAEVCDRFRKAEIELAERITHIQAIWLRTKSQLECVQQLAPLLDEEHRNIQEETLKVFASKLDIASTKLRSYLKKTEGNTPSGDEWQVKRSKYALFGKALDTAINELEQWKETFDPSWYLIMKAARPQIDVELETLMSRPARISITRAQSLRAALNNNAQAALPIFLPTDGLASIRVSAIPYCSAEFGQRDEANSNVILDHIACPAQINVRILKTDIRTLARKLSHADPITFGLLNCKGAVEHVRAQEHQDAFTLIFKIPRVFSEPRSLRSWLLEGDTAHSLSDRFRIATQLAKSVGYVHTFGFIHKNVLPETVLIFKDPESTIGSVSLVGFGNFRDADGGTLRSGDSLWERNIYRHPRRQGQKPKDDYIMQHDIYSLGVCLLELGLWESFIVYGGNSVVPSPSTALGFSNDGVEARDPFLTKDRLLSMTRELLPRRMGTRYTETVETCLTCLDDDNDGFGDERELVDQDGILVGVRYIEKVLLSNPFNQVTILTDFRSYTGSTASVFEFTFITSNWSMKH